MPNLPIPNMIRTRLTILGLSILGLVLTSLNSAIGRFAIVLRDRARSSLTETRSTISTQSFEQLMSRAFGDVLIAAIASALSSLVGLMLVVHPRWLRDHTSAPSYYGAMQLVLSLFILVTGAYLADHIYGFQASFAGLRGDDSIPYYSIMYYGGIGEAIYGALVILIGVGSFIFILI